MPYANFIAVSKEGFEKGSFIMHRCHGVTTDINTDGSRAVMKMKATITQRFSLDDSEVDAESDCRFCYFWIRVPETGDWNAMLVWHWYEEDKLIPVDPRKIPVIDDDLLATFPAGYTCLAYCQQVTMGVNIAKDMPGHLLNRGAEGATKVAGEMHDKLYWNLSCFLCYIQSLATCLPFQLNHLVVKKKCLPTVGTNAHK